MKTNPLVDTRRGFTLMELLVVVVIIMVLSAFGFAIFRSGSEKASSSSALSRLRESGFLLITAAQERNGMHRYALDDTPRNSPFLPYNIIREALEVPIPDANDGVQRQVNFCEIMHWDYKKLPPGVYHRNCFGVNFTNKLGVSWSNEIVVVEEKEMEVHTLFVSNVDSPSPFALLVDSSDVSGNEVFRIHEGGGDGGGGAAPGPSNGIKPHIQFPRRPELPSRVAEGLVGLRNSGKAHAFFLDGSTRSLSIPDLKAEGFEKAYDNSTTPPVLKSF